MAEFTQHLTVFVKRLLSQTPLFRCAAIGALSGAAAFGLLFPFPVHGRAWNALFDLAHAPAFAFLMVAAVWLLDPQLLGASDTAAPIRKLSGPGLLATAVGVTGFGIAAETAQALVGRSPSVKDVLANGAGIVSALQIILSIRLLKNHRNVLIAGGLFIAVVVSVSPMAEILSAFRQHKQLPILAAFESADELSAWSPSDADLSLSDEWTSDGSRSLRIDTLPGAQWPGVTMQWFPSDWSAYKALSLTLCNRSDQTVTLILKLADSEHARNGFPAEDRYERRIQLPPSMSENVQVSLLDVKKAPAHRTMDLTDMRLLQIYTFGSSDMLQIHLDSVRLHP